MSIDDIEDHFVTIVTVVGVMLLIGSIVFLGYSIWEEEATAETIILHDGSQSYACEVSRTNQKPHQCKPIKEKK